MAKPSIYNRAKTCDRLSQFGGSTPSPPTKFWEIVGIVAMVYLVSGIAGILIGKYYPETGQFPLFILALMISLIGIRWIEIVGKR